MSKKSRGSLTPTEGIAAEIRDHGDNRNHFIREAQKGAIWVGGLGGLAVWKVLTGDSVFAGIDAGLTLWFAADMAVDLNSARNASREAGMLRQALAQYELATGEIVPVYDE